MTRRCAAEGCSRAPLPSAGGLAFAECAECLRRALAAMFGRAK